MEEAKKFGVRLRELRLLALLTQRGLAEKVGIDFSYLSKIENGVLPPPSEKVILQLAEALNADKDELITLAGKIPADIAELLKNQKTLEILRSERTQKKVLAKKGEGINLVKDFKNMSQAVKTSIPIINYKSFARVALAVILVVAVGASLWFASPSPVKAIDITFPNLPESATRGQSNTFYVKISVQDVDLLPVYSVNLQIYDAGTSTYTANCTGLPLVNGVSRTYSAAQTGGGQVVVTTSTATKWGYAFGNRGLYGYSYQQGWVDHNIGSGWGYGYSSGSYVGSTSVTFTVAWTPPTGWPTGSYKVKATVYGGTGTSYQFYDSSNSISLRAASAGVVGASSPGSGAEPKPKPRIKKLAGLIDSKGAFNTTTTHQSEDGNLAMSISKGTTGTIGGEPLEELSITWEPDPPEPPKDTDIVINYNLGPDGATFDPAITLTFHYDENRLPEAAEEEALTVAWYDTSRGWVYFDAEDIIIDPDTNTITVKVDHFTNFAVMAMTSPAEFTVSNLMISPAQADIAQSVTVSADIANSGDLSGSYEVILKVNNEVESTQKLKMAGRTTEKVTFTVIKGAAGSYTVDINGQTGTFTVKSMAAPVTIPPAQPSIIVQAPEAPAPAPAPAPPAPTPTPVQPTNWLVIIIVAAAAVIVAGIVVWYFGFRREF
ncbi:helix-turn-helix domain-containing protein [Chloroflexota bacterium]